jgi:hypothetical protein
LTVDQSLEPEKAGIPVKTAARRVAEYVALWLVAEVAIGALGPLISRAVYKSWLAGQPAAGLQPSYHNAGDVVAASTALAASRVPDLLEYKSPSYRRHRRFLMGLVIAASFISLVAVSAVEPASGSPIGVSKILDETEVYYISAGMLITTLLLGILAQILRATEEAEQERNRRRRNIKTRSTVARARFHRAYKTLPAKRASRGAPPGSK